MVILHVFFILVEALHAFKSKCVKVRHQSKWKFYMICVKIAQWNSTDSGMFMDSAAHVLKSGDAGEAGEEAPLCCRRRCSFSRYPWKQWQNCGNALSMGAELLT